MPTPAIYDDAAYHFGSPFFSNKRANPHSAGTHIGMYLAWIIINRLESFALRQTAAVTVEEVRSKQTSGRELLFASCEGRLTTGELNKEAQAFTNTYYEDQYLRDYQELLVTKGTRTYAVDDSWANYERLAKIIDSRFLNFRGLQPAAS